MRDTTADAQPVVDIWGYVHKIPAEHLNGSTVSDEVVEYVYRSGDGRYDHVLVSTSSRNVYLVVVVDRPGAEVLGHLMLDLAREYGQNTPPNQE